MGPYAVDGMLIGKAADLKAKAEENAPPVDPSPKPPDVLDFPSMRDVR